MPWVQAARGEVSCRGEGKSVVKELSGTFVGGLRGVLGLMYDSLSDWVDFKVQE